MKKLIFIIFCFFTVISEAKFVKIAVIDSGFDFKSNWKDWQTVGKPNLCKNGHFDFTKRGIQDNIGHGTHIAGLIGKYANTKNYCIVVLKIFNKENEIMNYENLSIQAIKTAIELNVDMINYSAGGRFFNAQECLYVKKALDRGIRFVAAAGNNGENINKYPYYPAMCDERTTIVANIHKNGEYATSSNFTTNAKNARKLYKEFGVDVLSIFPGNNLAMLTGTSQSTAIKTGKLIKLIEQENYAKPNKIEELRRRNQEK